MTDILNLYGPESDLTAVKQVRAGLLCEFAPDSPWLREAERCYRADEMLGSADDALILAHSLVSRLLERVSGIDGLPSFTVFEEPLLEQVSYIVQAFHLDRWIAARGFSACRFNSYSPWLDRLRQVRGVTRSKYELMADLPFGQNSWTYRSARKLWKSRGRASELFHRVAPLWSRYVSGRRVRKLAHGKPIGGIWFYSTAYNYTKIALEYEKYFPQKMNFLIEDSATGGKRLSELGREFRLLWAWSRASDIPSPIEVRRTARRIEATIRDIPLANDESSMRQVLLSGDWWKQLLRRSLPFLLFHGRVLQRWCEGMAPEMLVVGNAGWERALLRCEAADGIPSLMLQHGIMHWVYAVADQPVTRFLLRGKFFQNLLNEKLRGRTIICNYPEEHREVAEAGTGSRRDILFITTPYTVPALFHTADLRDIVLSLLRVSQSVRRRLVIRVHPMERVSSYQKLVSEIQHESGLHAEVIYSQGPEVETVLAGSCVAVLFFSTMFLDCLRHGIPIISFGWHWFPNKQHFEAEGIFNFAANLCELEKLVHEGTKGELFSRRNGLEQFLAPTPADEVARMLREIWESRPGANHAAQEAVGKH
ncbi:MAG TPA: hypothetical protein VFO39_02445 [Candidatus Sulfotelmatobacter sp.]|nr:hypothetical protein [Candidatus Sulfotelmatobacter sp.]